MLSLKRPASANHSLMRIIKGLLLDIPTLFVGSNIRGLAREIIIFPLKVGCTPYDLSFSNLTLGKLKQAYPPTTIT
jgi:hypothetical protein